MADFGLARFQDEGGAMTAETGTYRWMAPEVVLLAMQHLSVQATISTFSFVRNLFALRIYLKVYVYSQHKH